MTVEIKGKENERLYALTEYERALWEQGIHLIAGMDEAGRGPLSGPVVAACVVFPSGLTIPGVNDSKKISSGKRERLFDEIKKIAISIGIGIVQPEEIDRINILNATRLAMHHAVENLMIKPEHILIDAVAGLALPIPQTVIIKGDAKSHSIAAASIVAKVTRDRMMEDYDRLFPAYGFAKHKGYGTKQHIEAIMEHGPCPIHRNSFIKNFIVHPN